MYRNRRPQWESRCRLCECEVGRERYRAAHGLALDGPLPRGPVPFDAEGLRVCPGCDKRLPAEDYSTWTSSTTGRVVTRGYCKTCTRHIANARRRQKRATSRVQRPPRVAPLIRAPRVVSRTCARCAETKPRASFLHPQPNGKVVLKAHCLPCRAARGRRQSAPSTSAPKLKAALVPVARPMVEQRPCALCTLPVSGKQDICKDCRRAVADQAAVESEAQDRVRQQARVLKGDHKGFMWTTANHVWGLDYECQGCRKPIWDTGKCYSCSTGRARTVLRYEERQAVAA